MKYKLSLLGLVGLALNAQSEDLQTSKINVYSPGPLPSIGLDRSIVPGAIQVIDPKDIAQQSGGDYGAMYVGDVGGGNAGGGDSGGGEG